MIKGASLYYVFDDRDFLDADMHRTKVIISSISSLLALEDEELEHFITGSVN